jgi:prophage antirepressor-like protein
LLFDGEPCFIGKDVAGVLGYANPQKAVRDHCKAARPLGVNETFTPAIDPQTVIIPERDVYRLIMRSKLPRAERFEVVARCCRRSARPAWSDGSLSRSERS